jgi:hypothetical protein
MEIHLARARLGACVGFGEVKRESTRIPRGAVKTKGGAVLARTARPVSLAAFFTVLAGPWPAGAMGRAAGSIPRGKLAKRAGGGLRLETQTARPGPTVCSGYMSELSGEGRRPGLRGRKWGVRVNDFTLFHRGKVIY